MKERINKKLYNTLPYPLAVVWRRVGREQEDYAQRYKYLNSTLEIFLRYTSGIVLAAYLRHPPSERVEQEMKAVTQPKLGEYVGIIREGLRYLRSQEDPFVDELCRWFFTPNVKPTEEAKLLNSMITIRNTDAHGPALGGSKMQKFCEELEDKLMKLLYKSEWLKRYRLFSILSKKRIRRTRTQQGNISFFVGETPEDQQDLGWKVGEEHDEKIPYLCHPDGAQWLEMYPFVSILEESSRNEMRPFVWISVTKKGLVHSRHDSTTQEEDIGCYPGEKVPWNEWLELRAEFLPVLENQMPESFVYIEPQAEEQGVVLSDEQKYSIHHVGNKGAKQTMVLIPAESFRMGSVADESVNEDETPRHEVRLTQPFFAAQHMIRQRIYRKIMGDNPSEIKGDEYPVVSVTWMDVLFFCNQLSQREGLEQAYTLTMHPSRWQQADAEQRAEALAKVQYNPKANGYRLPTEAEWEYMCKAGVDGAYVEDMQNEGRGDDVAWNFDNSEYTLHAVGLKAANPWKIFDLLGNAYEWCWDNYAADYYNHAETVNPKGPKEGIQKVRRGGCWYYDMKYCRPAARNAAEPLEASAGIGFRVVRNYVEEL